MELADITLMAFTACNSIRVLAYVPQIWKAATDDNGAKALSYTTWCLFFVSHVTTAAYSVVNRQDLALATMFLVNAAACAIILAVAAWRRAHHKPTRTEVAASNIIPLRLGRVA
jgi:hypothetical protein